MVKSPREHQPDIFLQGVHEFLSLSNTIETHPFVEKSMSCLICLDYYLNLNGIFYLIIIC